MNEQNPEIPPVEPTAPPEYKDRSNGLLVFGILTILLGSIAGMLLLLMLVGQVVVRSTHMTVVPASILLLDVFIYGILAVVLIWLGIGSIMARRWARALLLIFSWSWLVMGVFAVLGVVVFLPIVLENMRAAAPPGQPAMPAAAIGVIMVITCLMLGVFFIALPAVWIFFYKSRHVKATCEARDPVTRWTDVCPLPVLGLCVWLWFSAPMMLVMPIIVHGVMPFFGMFLTGLPGTAFCLAIAALWAWCAWLLYKLDARGWWLILIAMIVVAVSAVLTYARHDVIEIYQLMGYPQEQIDQIQKTGLLTENRMTWITLFSIVPFLGYILFVKKYLRGKS
jgi:hypothetical protein